jgi:GTP-binding protein
MFIDSVKISVKAGKGGDGIVAFRREKYVDKGGPSGGKGGRGGDIIFVGESGLTTLLDFRFTRKIKAESGQNGMSKDMFGKDAKDTYVKVPIGTVVYDADTGKILADITKHGEEAIIAKGGRGGRGNGFFATSRNPAPDFCEKGFPGEEYNRTIFHEKHISWIVVFYFTYIFQHIFLPKKITFCIPAKQIIFGHENRIRRI